MYNNLINGIIFRINILNLYDDVGKSDESFVGR